MKSHASRLSPRRLAARAALPAALALLVLAVGSPAVADVVYKRNGEVLEGKVSDRGDHIFLKQKLGGVRIPKDQIDRITYDKTPEGAKASDEPDDIVVQTGGREVRGRARFSPDGKEVWVTVRGQKVSIPADHVREIHWKGVKPKKEAKPEAGRSKEEIQKKIRESLAQLESEDALARRSATQELKRIGVFAIPMIETLHKESEAGSTRRAILDEILRFHRLKAIIDSNAESKIPDIYDRLASLDPERRAGVLKEIVLDAPKSAPKILMHFLEEDRDTSVRALCVSQLSMLRCFKELLAILKMPNGRLRVAAAMALGDHGILTGVPVLVDLLALDDKDYRTVIEKKDVGAQEKAIAQRNLQQLFTLRALAGQKLREITGQDFGFRPLATNEERLKAVERWRRWWKRNETRLLEQSAKLAASQVNDDDRKQAAKYWTEANDQLARFEGMKKLTGGERRDMFERVAFLYKRAIQFDPTFVKARISLAYVYYNELGRLGEAKLQLRSVLNQTSGVKSKLPRTLCYIHLAAVARREGDFKEAELRLYDARRLDDTNLDVHLAMGDLYLEWALLSGRLPSDRFGSLPSGQPREETDKGARKATREERAKAVRDRREARTKLIKKRLVQAQVAYKRGLDEVYRQEETLRADSQKLITTDNSDFRKAALLQALRANLKALGLRSASFYYGLGRVDASLGFYQSAQRNFSMASKMDLGNKRYKKAARYWKDIVAEQRREAAKNPPKVREETGGESE